MGEWDEPLITRPILVFWERETPGILSHLREFGRRNWIAVAKFRLLSEFSDFRSGPNALRGGL